MFKAISLLFSSLLLTIPSSAYFSVLDTGEVVKTGEYKVLAEGQFLTDAPEGFNLNGRFATGIDEESELQIELGFGSIDFNIGGFYKWVPVPDTDDQPAVGVRAGFTFAQVSDFSTYGLNVTPFASKKFETEHGVFSPYVGVPIGLQQNSIDTRFSLQASIGLEWIPDQWSLPELYGFRFLTEYSFEIDDAFSYFSIASSYSF